MAAVQLLDTLIDIFKLQRYEHNDKILNQQQNKIMIKRSMESNASDMALIVKLTNIINAAYTEGEQGMWKDGSMRTNVDEVLQLIQDQKLILAFAKSANNEEQKTNETIVGCIKIDPSFDSISNIGAWGMLAIDKDWGGLGIATRLINEAESILKNDGCLISRLEILKPSQWAHPKKIKLHAWYTRLGYKQVSSIDFGESIPQKKPSLNCDCKLHVFHKTLQ